MNIKEIEAKSILRKYKKIDSWFIAPYCMNLYRGCTHNCVYCDGRAEKYQTEDDFGNNVAVKTNAIEVLRRELDPSRKRKPMRGGFIGIGGGVGDSYQPVEERYQLTRQTLELIYQFSFPVFVLTKSTLVERDIDILKKINDQKRAIISFSFSSADDEVSSIFEPGVPPPSQRLELMKKLKSAGFPIGMYLLPVIPFITDTEEMIKKTIESAKMVGVDFIVFGGMTLKHGKQKRYFFDVLNQHYPHLATDYQTIYQDSPWGSPTEEYSQSIHETFYHLIKHYKIPPRIPFRLYHDLLNEDDLVIVLLEHIDYMLKLMGRTSPYSYAAYSVSQLKQPLSDLKTDLKKLKGVGPTTERIILEILKTGRSSYYDKLYSEMMNR